MPTVTSFLKTHGRPVLTVNASDTLVETARRFGEKTGGQKYSLAVVCDGDGRPVGVIALGDIVYAIATHAAAAVDLTVERLMTSEIIAASPNDDVRDLLRLMADKDIRHMPVIAEGQLLGLVARRDALEFLYDSEALELEQLRSFIFRSGARY